VAVPLPPGVRRIMPKRLEGVKVWPYSGGRREGWQGGGVTCQEAPHTVRIAQTGPYRNGPLLREYGYLG
jgi:hypothetical protein